MLDGKLKMFHDQLEGVEVKMQAKIADINNLTGQNTKLQKQVDELRALLLK